MQESYFKSFWCRRLGKMLLPTAKRTKVSYEKMMEDAVAFMTGVDHRNVFNLLLDLDIG